MGDDIIGLYIVDIMLEKCETLVTCHYEICSVTEWSGRAGSWWRCRCWWWRCSPRASAWISAPNIFSVQIGGSNEDLQIFYNYYWLKALSIEVSISRSASTKISTLVLTIFASTISVLQYFDSYPSHFHENCNKHFFLFI